MTAAMYRRRRAWLRLAGGGAILAAVVWRLGTGPFIDAFGRVDAKSLVAATAITAVTTACCAWRWVLVAGGLGIDIPMRSAFAAYYRSQFLNTTLPGGVLGDVDRAVRHGREVGDVGRGVRAVVWERTAGQAVQVILTLFLLFLLPSPVRSAMPIVTTALVAVALTVVILGRRLPLDSPAVLSRTVRAIVTDLRDGVFDRQVLPGIVLTSAVVAVGHALTFLIAARTAGSTSSPVTLLPLALIVLLAMGIPLNIAGWGPREGVAAWVFGMAGLGSAQGVATAVVYGVIGLVATLPGAVVLIVTWRGKDVRSSELPVPPRPLVAAHRQGATHA
jgi:glycosyltransferase 2 family protein